MTSLQTTVYLIEPYAHEANGHWSDSLKRLATAATRSRRTIVVSPRKIPPSLQAELASVGAVVRHPLLDNLGNRNVYWMYRATRRAEQLVRRVMGDECVLAEDLWLLGMALQEVILLRAVLQDTNNPSARKVIVLTGSSCFLGLIQKAARVPHVRIIHDADGPRCRLMRSLDRLWASNIEGMTLACTNDSIRRKLVRRGIDIPAKVQPFAIRDDGDYLKENEKAPARKSIGIASSAFVVALVGGWWKVKDIKTVAAALSEIPDQVHVLVAGNPLDPEVLSEMRKNLGNDRLTIIGSALSAAQLRQIYACSDASIVSRWAGVDKESGLVADAAKYGVPLIVSDHDAYQTKQLIAEPWVAVFTAQDPKSLAQAITKAFEGGLARPSATAAISLGLMSADEVLESLTAEPTPSRQR